MMGTMIPAAILGDELLGVVEDDCPGTVIVC
jgi:hypothetical protein